MERYLIFFSIVATAAANTGFDYCTLNCHLPNGTEVKHFACGKTGEFGPDCPPDVSIVNMDEPMQKAILHEHNKLRNFVAGGANETYTYKPACRMGTLQWSDNLATVSVFHSATCRYEEALCRATEHFPDFGQFYTIRYVFSKRTSAIESFKKIFSYNINLFLNAPVSDILADRNVRLGCSGTYTPLRKNSTAFQYNCFYSTNIQEGESMYTECERPATGCETGTNPEYPNLCSTDEQYENYAGNQQHQVATIPPIREKELINGSEII